jgi:hypothetical protein
MHEWRRVIPIVVSSIASAPDKRNERQHGHATELGITTTRSEIYRFHAIHLLCLGRKKRLDSNAELLRVVADESISSRADRSANYARRSLPAIRGIQYSGREVQVHQR